MSGCQGTEKAAADNKQGRHRKGFLALSAKVEKRTPFGPGPKRGSVKRCLYLGQIGHEASAFLAADVSIQQGSLVQQALSGQQAEDSFTVVQQSPSGQHGPFGQQESHQGQSGQHGPSEQHEVADPSPGATPLEQAWKPPTPAKVTPRTTVRPPKSFTNMKYLHWNFHGKNRTPGTTQHGFRLGRPATKWQAPWEN
jgi:hypothetical protein